MSVFVICVFVTNFYVCLAETGLLGQPWGWPVPCLMATSGAASVRFTPGVRLTDRLGSASCCWPTRMGWWARVLAHQEGLVGQRFGLPGQGLAGRFWWPARTSWRAGVVAHQDMGWWAGVWRTRTGAGGQCVDAPRQAGGQCRPRPRSVLELRHGASCQAHWACARFVPVYVRGLCLGMSGRFRQYM